MAKEIILNHKMNLTYDDVLHYIDSTSCIRDKFIVCPSSVYLSCFTSAGYTVGVQNVYIEDSGSYTGEISPSQVKSLGCEYVIIGHSERRRLFKEDNFLINKKIKACLENGLKVILCVGESIPGDVKDIIYSQIKEALDGINGKVYISYEPVWAIGNGLTPTKDDLALVIDYIKSLFDYDVPVLYGGSVNSHSAKILNEIDSLSGFLIGSAGLDVLELKKIIEVVK